MGMTSHDAPSSTRYGVDTTLRIRNHEPPEPFTGTYGPCPRRPADWSRWKGQNLREIDRVEFALANPPFETDPPGSLERTLTVTGVKTIRNRGGPHVVTCFLDGDPSTEYIAKIFDGVDYSLGDPGPGLFDYNDCMSFADRDYSIEAWAYRTMQPVIGGTFVPAYHGSWTFPVGERWVRMILVELVQGECMLDIITRAEDKYGLNVDYARLPPEDFRIRVLKNIHEANLFIWWHAGVRHDDLVPRNVMVKPDGSVVIIDFNHVYIYDFTPSYDMHPRTRELNPRPLPPSLIERLWPFQRGFKTDYPWIRWLPQRWIENPILAAEWVMETYRDDPRCMPPSAFWLNKDIHKEGGEKALRLLESLGREPAASEAPDPQPSEGLTE
ncbi:hypothetical protein C8A00DRAFT_29329 [Chaetomidium leptoderma]|uniref:Protein kinase domain-containing protein n=1 Tax=Chaetomidium leptoderma TaxID=669021 RepID=A0AAN7A0Q4_9PEZI|nr:hypothetical protein C8A00DRAFT_29329 [Chaetomidium leptoderma]